MRPPTVRGRPPAVLQQRAGGHRAYSGAGAAVAPDNTAGGYVRTVHSSQTCLGELEEM